MKKKTKKTKKKQKNFPPFLPPPSPPPTPLPLPPNGGAGESDDDDDHDDDDNTNRNLTSTQRFLLDQPQRTAVAVSTNNAAISVPLQEKKLDFLKILGKYFLNQMIYSNQIISQK